MKVAIGETQVEVRREASGVLVARYEGAVHAHNMRTLCKLYLRPWALALPGRPIGWVMDLGESRLRMTSQEAVELAPQADDPVCGLPVAYVLPDDVIPELLTPALLVCARRGMLRTQTRSPSDALRWVRARGVAWGLVDRLCRSRTCTTPTPDAEAPDR